MTKVLFIGRVSLNNPISCLNSYKQNMYYLGDNTGNLAFTTGIETYLRNRGTQIIYTDNLTEIANPIDPKIKTAVVSCSNWLNGGKTKIWFETAAEQIDKSKMKMKVFVFGLGLQVKEIGGYKNFSRDYNQSVSRFIEAVYESGGAISVRGESTKDYFRFLGHENHCFVTGCPSIYQLGKTPIFRPYSKERRYATNGNMLNSSDFNHMINSNVVAHIDQDIYYKYLFHGSELTYVNKYNFLNRTELEREFLVNNKVYSFNSLFEWGSFLNDRDITMTFGSKIHGTIVPIIFGFPGVVIAIDQRIRELTAFMGIPNISYDEAKRKNLDTIYDEFYDMGEFKRRYPLIRKNFQDFIDIYNIPMKLPEDRTVPEQRHCSSITNTLAIKNLNLGYKSQNKHLFLLKKYPSQSLKYYLNKIKF